MTDCTPINECLACGGASLQPYFDAGMQPLANSFHDGSTELPRYPLGLNVCMSCFHSQLTHVVDPHLMFDEYLYVSGTSETLRKSMASFARIIADRPIKSRVLEIGCNDGTLLNEFKKLGHEVLGVEPAKNLSNQAARQSVRVLAEYWSERVVDHLCNESGPFYEKPFDIIIAMNVLAHVADPLTFLKLCKRVLAPGGRIYVQTSQAKMIERGEFDTVYHEHHSFFTVSSMLALAHRAGLRVDAISHVPVHGTSYLFELVEDDDYYMDWYNFAIGRVEHDNGYYAINIYERFSEKAEFVRRLGLTTIADFRAQGYRIVGYGAAAKAVTFINYCDLTLDCIIDDNPMKVGKLTPGMNIPVVEPPMILTSLHKILFVILAWNFRDEIMARIKAVRGDLIGSDGDDDRFLTFFPEVELI